MARELSRRGLLTRIVPETAEHVAEKVQEFTGMDLPERLRPPGAVAEARFLELCTRCGECSSACPHHAVYSLGEWVVPGAGTPVMVVDERPCHLCEDYPCIKACEPKALEPTEGPWKLGHVVLDTEHCLPFKGPECGACAGLCPSGSAGLRLQLTKPIIDEESCVGCGLCIEACPTTPKALTHVPPGGIQRTESA